MTQLRCLRPLRVVFACLFVILSYQLVRSQTAARFPRLQPQDEAKFYQKRNFNHLGKAYTFELTGTPLPFVDWTMVETGHMGWMGENGDVVPLNDKHPYQDEKQILPVPFGVASGVRIRVQKPQKGASFDEFIPPTLPWETGLRYANTLLYDADENLYKLWYYNLGTNGITSGLPPIAYAESTDLKTWRKPLVSPISYKGYDKTNLIYITNADESGNWIFQAPEGSVSRGQYRPGIRPGYGGAFFRDDFSSPSERYKTTFVTSSIPEKLRDFAQRVGKPLSPMVSPRSAHAVYGAVSPDGIGWRILKDPILLHDADTQTVIHFDPWIERYVMFTRLFEFGRRTIARTESTTFTDFPLPYSVISSGPDDEPYLDFYDNAFRVYPGNPDIGLMFVNVYNRALDMGTIRVAVSRNGVDWDWVPGGPIMEPEGEWGLSWFQVHPTFVRTPDHRMIVTYTGTVLPHKFPRHHFRDLKPNLPGVAWWKEDRLVALEAPEQGEFTTPYMILRGDEILLNMKTERAGYIQVELFDENFKRISGRTFAESDPLTGDSLAMPVTWNGESDLSKYRDKVVFLRFKLRAAKLYAISAVKN